jgi:phosphatidate cytidylyltransferase
LLRSRLFTAAVAIPLLAWLFFLAPAWIFNGVVLFATWVALREFSLMALSSVPGAATLTTLGGMMIAASMVLVPGGLAGGAALSAGIVACLILTLVATLATARDMGQSVNSAGQVLLGALYGGALLPHLIWLRGLPGGDGPSWVFFVFSVVMAGDVGGYFGGKMLGTRKLWPSVSPNKTVEGSLVSFGSSLVAGILVNSLILHRLGLFETLFVAGVMSVLAQLGDLLESMIKRAYRTKDSGWILPGHGGVLDRTDSLVLPIVFVYYYAILVTG